MGRNGGDGEDRGDGEDGGDEEDRGDGEAGEVNQIQNPKSKISIPPSTQYSQPFNPKRLAPLWQRSNADPGWVR